MAARPSRLPFPEDSPPGPFRPGFWRSPLRGPWLASFLSSALLPLIVVCALTGFLSHAAYEPDLGRNALIPAGPLGIDLYFFRWPTSPAWLYALTQGLHVATGLAAIPILLAKLWAVIPKLFEWPPVRSPAHALERLGLALLVGSSLLVFFTGVFNIQLYYAWNFSFIPAHYYASFVFLAALTFHIALKLPVVRRSFRDMGVVAPLREGLADTSPEPPNEPSSGPDASADEPSSAPLDPARPTVSRRVMLGSVGAGSLLLMLMAAGQSIGGPFRHLALLAPRASDPGSGPNAFQVNKTAEAAGITPGQTGEAWRLLVSGERKVTLSREDLLALPQATERLPIACVEGWSTTQTWTGVRLRDLARLAGVAEPTTLDIESVQKSGPFRRTTLSGRQAMAERSLLALQVNGADLSLDHGYPARIIVPALPGVHNTKWVRDLSFRSD